MAVLPERALARQRSFYRRLLWLYPASFRRQYGEAMVQLFCDRLRGEPGGAPRSVLTRVWLQTGRDLALSVPHERIEVFMSEQHTSARLATAIVALSLSIAAVALLGIAAVVALVVVIAWLAYHETRGRHVRLPGESKWYRWVLGGVAGLAVGSLPLVLSLEGDWVWGLSNLFGVLGLLGVAAGIAIGVRDLRRRPGGPTPA